jgi:hypothetical protein
MNKKDEKLWKSVEKIQVNTMILWKKNIHSNENYPRTHFPENFPSLHVYSRSFLYIHFGHPYQKRNDLTGSTRRVLFIKLSGKNINVFCSKILKSRYKKETKTLKTFSCFIYLFTYYHVLYLYFKKIEPKIWTFVDRSQNYRYALLFSLN